MATYLGFYLGHDTNVAVSQNGRIRYRKSERHFSDKHHRAEFEFILETLENWGVDKVDYCAYTDGNRRQLGRCAENELFCKGTLQNWKSFCIDHHYAHALSVWPLVDTEKLDFSVSVDGRGDWLRSMMTIKSPAKNPEIVNVEVGHSLGFEFYELGRILGFTGLEYDFAGKMMGLQSYPEDQVSQFGVPRLADTNYKSVLKSAAKADYDTYSGWHEYWWSHLQGIFSDIPRDAYVGYSGGCAQNSVYNYRLKQQYPNLFIPPHCYDGGLSLGCLEFLRLQFGDDKFDVSNFPFWQDDNIVFLPDDNKIRLAARFLADGKIIGWMQGQGELGPRALGHRSILMNAGVADNKNIINRRVKKREAWRPYAGTVLKEHAKEYFDLDESKYMLFACNVVNDTIPAITHVDGTCRMQTVSDGLFYDLIREYQQLTGVPVILNTSLNVMGRPIASYRQHAVELVKTTDIDAVFVGNEVLSSKLKVI